MDEPKCILTVDVEALAMRAPEHHVDKLIYGRIDGGEWGIGKMMDVADKYNVKMTFFLDFAEVELYGEEIIEVGKYIISRGHDLQIHCHYNLLEKKIFERFPQADRSYYAWYEDEGISDFIVDYCLEQYHKCTENPPVIFRGGEYRFEEAILRKLKEKGIMADASYNFMRPLKKPIHKQFVFENGLLELPVGILPKQGDVPPKALNFNEAHLYPAKKEDLDGCLKEYEKLFYDFYDYYGKDALAAMLMHSWSFCYEKERFLATGYIDSPNPYAADFFERFLSHFSSQIDFIPAVWAVREEEIFTKTVDFDAVFSLREQNEIKKKLERIEIFIKRKASGRKVVIWGKGWIEGRIMRIRDFQRRLNVEFYISRDADKNKLWRGKPVKTFRDAKISKNKYYVFVIANICFPEIRGSLQKAGFVENEDYYDILQSFPEIREKIL